VRQAFGELTDGPLDTSRVAASHDERGFFPEGLLDDLNEPLARREGRLVPFVRLAQLIEERMRHADDHEDRLALGSGDAPGHLRDRQGDARGLETEPRREVHDAVGPVAIRGEQDVDAIGNQVVVRVGQRTVDGVERREIEVFLCAAAWAAGRRRRRSVGSCGGDGSRNIDGRHRGARAAQTHAEGSDIRVRERPFRVAAANRDHLIERNLRFDHVARRELQVHDQPLGAVGIRAHERRCRDRSGRGNPLRAEEFLHLVRDLVGRRALLIPHERQVSGEHECRGGDAAVIAAEDGERGLPCGGERRDQTVAGFQWSTGGERVDGRSRFRERLDADVDGRGCPAEAGRHTRGRSVAGCRGVRP
jgi:hypothetical protein